MPYQDPEFGCSVDVGLHMISSKWKPRIIYELLQQTRRFGELHRAIPGISRHVLTVQLRELEESDIVQRTVIPSVPLKVEYALTEFGKSLKPVLAQMITLGEHYIALRREEMKNGADISRSHKE
ncbi:helix-turn-helix domain-containing protein [Brevibacillus choshinensis]|uniref:winged helix-turn-helix transcriptional regulator n=1 Tax=Brevibacillus choshinensis TaxID=54911 RepID=UPI002E20F496|nr:helix-turn-helix domain-containing protein [Brevibacillus choshinensis]